MKKIKENKVESKTVEPCVGLCLDKKPQEYHKLFFGDYGNLQRTDIQFHEVFEKLAQASEANTWFMNEIDYTKDKKGYALLSEAGEWMFHANILYQENMDSLVPNTFGALSELATDSWLTYVYNRISTEEDIHAMTYSNGLVKVFGAKATAMIDYVYEDAIIKARTDKEIETARRFLIAKNTYFMNPSKENLENLKKALLEQLVRTYFLEGVKFPFSFFTTFRINKAFNNAIQGFTQSLKLIAWDELTVHVPVGLNVMKILFRDENQDFLHLEDYFKDLVVNIAQETLTGELEWNEYLHHKGSIPGFTQDIGEHFIKYMTDYRIKALIGEEYTFTKEPSSDIISWFNEYRDLNKTSVALQEADNTNYQKATVKNDLDLFDDFTPFN